MKKKIYFKTDTGFIVREAEWDMTSTQMGDLWAEVKIEDNSARPLKVLEIIVSGHNPLSNQCFRITGDHYWAGAWSNPFGKDESIIQHIETGLYVQVYGREIVKGNNDGIEEAQGS